MNFKIYDDEFDENKKEYLKQIQDLSQGKIIPEMQKQWQDFVKKTLVDTRSYYILIYSLKVMQNLDNKQLQKLPKNEFFNTVLLSAMTFMPDKTFIETSIMIVAKFHRYGKYLAKYHKVDIAVTDSKK